MHMPVSGIDPAAGGLKIKYTATKLQPPQNRARENSPIYIKHNLQI